MNVYIFKYSLLLSFFAGIIVVGCVPKDKKDNFDKVLSFSLNIVNTKPPELICKLSEENILLKDIVDFTFINDTSFVVLDGQGAYLYHISGTFKKQFGNRGQAGGEMISPSIVYATHDFVYIWCNSLMKFMIFDHEANFKYELSGFKKSVRKFAVDPSNEILYLYTSGIFNELENKMIDVIDVFNITEKSSKQFGERCPEDEVLFTFSNSSGLYVNTDRFIYLHPGNLILHDLDLNSDKTFRYKIEDKEFHREMITSNIRDIMESRTKLFNYLYRSSLVKGLYKNNNQFIIVSEIGESEFDEQTRIMNNRNRKVKLYILDSFFTPIHTILFDYIKSPNIAIHSNSLYFITLIDSDDQIFALKRFPLSEE